MKDWRKPVSHKWDQFKQEFRPLLKLAWPLVLAEMGWMVMGLVDTMMVGRLPESANAIGAVSLGSVSHHVVIFFGAGMLLGLDTLVSQAFGAGRVKDCHHFLIQGIYLGLFLCPFLMGAIWLLLPWAGEFGFHPDVHPLAASYLKAVVWSTLPLLLYFAARRYLQAMDLAKPILFALISANVVNVVANWALIFGNLGAPAMGVEGSGWATVISRTYMGVFLLGYAFYYDHKHTTGLSGTSMLPDFARLKKLVRLGFPAGVQMTLEISIFALVTALIGTLDPISLASHQIALNMAAFTYMMPLGVSSAAAVRVGQALGRGDPRGAAYSGWASLALGVGLMACSAILFLLFRRQIAGVFTTDPKVIELSVTLLALAAAFQLFDGIQIVATGSLRGAGDTRTPMIVNILGFWLVGLPVGWFLGFTRGWGAPGLWVGLCTGLMLVGVVLLAAWFVKVKKLPDLIPRTEASPAD